MWQHKGGVQPPSCFLWRRWECRGHRETVTGDCGAGGVSGQIVMASGMANASPAGVRVAGSGTGMAVVVGADGRFAFANAPEGAHLIFERQSDGVNARLSLASTSAPVAGFMFQRGRGCRLAPSRNRCGCE